MRKVLLVIFFITGFSSYSQSLQLSAYSEISIVTVGPGDQLFTAFGHTAIRVKDPVLRIDHVYNYGMFDFNQPNFYLNFAEGKLLYKLGAYPFRIFIQQNSYEKRWVKEQILNLNQKQKQQFFSYLSINLLPENVSYLYDPFYDNCATKPIEIIQHVLKEVTFNKDFVTGDLSIRRLMNEELNQNTWGSFGINLALGSRIDKKANFKDYLYLPDYVYESLNTATLNTNNTKIPLVKKKNTILDLKEIQSESSFFNPLFIFLIILVFCIYISIKDFKNKVLTKWFDIVLFAVTGLIGIGIMYLWFFTNHTTTPNNYNILWCFPLNIFVFFFWKNIKLHRIYLMIATVLLFITPLVWLLRLQEYNYTFIPFLLILGIRYVTQLQLLSSKK